MKYSVLLALSLLLLTGCASAPKAPSLFFLNSPQVEQDLPVIRPAQTATTAIIVRKPKLSAWLDGNGLAYQTQANELVITRQNQWAAPLQSQLQNTLTQTLKQQLSNAQIYSGQPAPKNVEPVYYLTLHIDQFQGRYDGQAIIRGHWQLSDQHNQPLLEQPFSRQQGLTEGGYPALVTTLNQEWQAILEQLVAQLEGFIASQE